MNIAIVTETFLPSTDGVVTRITRAIDYMVRMGHSVKIYAPDVEGVPGDYKGAEIVTFPAYIFPFYKDRPWGLPSRELGKALEKDTPDVVHAVNPISLAASGVRYADKLEIPLVASFHTNIPHYLAHYNFEFLEPVIWGYLRRVHNKAGLNMVTSQAMVDLLEKNAIEELVLLPKGVDIDNRNPRFENETMRQRLMSNDQCEKLLIFVGRIAPEKEIDSLREILDRRPDVNLAVIGDGPDREHLEEHFDSYPVCFTGFLHDEELSQAFASGDAFIFPSISETLGLVITEAMASGTPVIAAKSEPTLEQITHKENGFIYDRESMASLEEALNLLDDTELVDRVIKNGRHYAERFSWDKASQAMLDTYIEVYEAK